MFTWKTLNGKNHGSPQTPTITMRGGIQCDTQRQRPRALCLRQNRRLQHKTSSLYLSLHPLYTTIYNNSFCYNSCGFPKSYLYSYEFRAIYKYSLNGLTLTYLQICPWIRFAPDPSGFSRSGF